MFTARIITSLISEKMYKYELLLYRYEYESNPGEALCVYMK